MPTTDPLGVVPAPLAPRVFQDIYALGKNPDGNYWKEYDGSGARFNLFERVCERVPASRPWLLKGFLPYQREDPPPIAHSRAHLSSFLTERKLMFLPRRAVSALEHLRPRLYQYVQKRAIRDLVGAATPSTLIFLMAFLHEVAWWAKGRPIEDTARSVEDAVFQFCESLNKREFDDAPEIAEGIKWPLHRAVASIKHWGDRSPPAGYSLVLANLPPAPLLIEDTPELRDACACLHAAGEEFYECIGQPLPPRYEALSGADWAPTEESVRIAIRTLMAGVLRAHRNIADEYERDLLCTPPAARFTTQVVASRRGQPGHRDAPSKMRQAQR